MPKGLQVQTTGSGVVGGGQVHKFLDDGSVVFSSGSLAAGVDNKSVTFFDATHSTGDITVYGDLSASVGITASAFHGDGSNLTGLAASSLTVADGGDNDSTVYILGSTTSAGSGASILTDGQLTYNNSTNALTVTTVKGTNVSGSTKLATARLEDVGGALALDGGAAITIDATTGLSLDAGAASNFSTSAGALTLDGAGGINIGTASDVAIDVDSSTLDIDASGAITVDSTSTIVVSGDGGATFGDDTEALAYDGSGNLDLDAVALDIDASGAVTLNGATTVLIQGNTSATFGDDTEALVYDGSGNLDLDAVALDIDASGAVTIDGTSTMSIDSADDSNVTVTGAGKDLTLSVAGGGAQELVLSSAGTGANAIHLNASAGSINMDSADVIDIDAADEITIDTTSADGHIALTSAHTAGQAILISANTDAGSILDVDAGIMDVDVQGAFTLDASGVSIDSDAASNLTTSSGALTLTSAAAATWSTTAGALTLDGAAGVNIAGNAAEIDITTSDALDLNSGAGTWNASTLDLTSTAAMTIDSGGVLTIDTDGTDAINLGTEAVAKTITIGNDASTKVDVNALAIELDAAAGIVLNSVTTTTLDSTQGMSLDAGAASNFSTTAGALTLSGSAMVVATSVLSASYNVSASAFYGDGSNLSGIAADSITVADGGDNDGTVYILGSTAASGETSLLTDGQLLYDNSTNTLSTTALSGSTKLATARLEDVGGALALAGGAAVTIDATTGLSLDAGAASNFTTSAGALTITAGAASTWSTSAGALTIDSAGVLTMDTDGTDAINLGTEAAAKTITIGNDASTKVDVNALAIELDSAGSIVLNSVTTTTLDSTQGMSFDAGAASNFSTSAGALTLDGAGGINIGTNADAAIDVDSSTLDIDASGAITVDSTSTIVISGDGGATLSDDTEGLAYDGSGNVDFDAVALDIDASGAVTIDGTGTVSIDGADDMNFSIATGGSDAKDLTIASTGGGDSSVLVSSAGTGADALSLDVSAGSMVVAPSLIDGKTLTLGNTSSTYMTFTPHGTAGSEKIILSNEAGTAADAVKIHADAGGITLDADSTTHGVKIGTGVSGAPVTIGHTTSEVTVADNLTVTGDLTVNGTTTTVSTTNLLVEDALITLNDGGADNTARGSGIEFEENGSVAGFIKTSADGEEFELKVPEGGYTLVLDVDADKTVTVAGALNIEADSVINQDLSTDSTTATLAGLSLSDGNITNVGDINADSISVDAAGTGLNVDFSGGNTGTNAITLQDGIADALSVTDGSNDWMVFNTSAETLQLGKDTNVVGNLTASMNISASVNMSASAFYGDGSNLTGVGGAVSTVSDSADYHFAVLSSNAAQDGATFYVENANVLKYNPNNDELMLSGTLTSHTGAFNTLTFDYLSGAAGQDITLSSEQDVVFVIDANGSGTQNYEFKAGQTSVAELSETGHFQISGALSASLAISSSIAVSASHGAFDFLTGDGSGLTNLPAGTPTLVNITDTADANTTYNLVMVDGLTTSETIEAGDDLTFNASTNVLTAANVSGSTKLATARVEDAGGALAIFGGAAVTVDATTGLSLDAGAASNLSTSAGALTVHGAGGINIGTTSDVAIDMDSSTLDIDASGAITVDSTSTIVISGDGGATLSDDTEGLAYDGSGNVDFDTVALDIDASGAVTLNGATTVLIQGNTSATFGDDTEALVYDGSGNLDLDAVALDVDASGAVTIDGTSTISIDGADDMNFSIATGGSDAKDLTIASTGGGDSSILVSSAGTGADALSLDVSAGSMVVAPSLADGQTLKLGKNGAVEMVFTPHGTAGNEKFLLTNTAGTAADAIKLDSTAGGITLSSANTTHGVKIGTATSGVPITIGHTTSEVTVADNLTVTGDLTVSGVTTTLDTTNLLVEDPIVVLNKANSSANGQGGIAIENGGSSADMVIGRVANDTWGVGTKDTSGGTVTTVADMTLGSFRASKLELDGATDYIDVDTDLKVISAADIVLDPGGSDVKVDGNLLPNASDGGALGSADNEWSDLFLADDAIIKFGDGQDAQLAHDNSNQLLTFSAANSDYGLKMPSVNGASAQGQAFLEKIVTGTAAGAAGTAASAYNGVMFYLAAVHGGSATAGQAGYSAQLTFTTAGKFYFVENGIVFPSPFINE